MVALVCGHCLCLSNFWKQRRSRKIFSAEMSTCATSARFAGRRRAAAATLSATPHACTLLC